MKIENLKLKIRLKRFLGSSLLVPTLILFILPVSSNYQLKSYSFGAGGESQSATYGIEGTTEHGSGEQAGTNYSANSGLVFIQNANVPTVTLVNSSSWYNKLLVTIGEENNPTTETTYAIAISSDDWATTNYVQSDNTVGVTLGTEDYQTYANWGSGSGEQIIGLTRNTTYKVKVKALHGRYTESAYGPEASAATSNLILSFDIDIGGVSDPGETAGPYSIGIGELTLGSVITATNRVWIDFATNAELGGYVYVYDENAGLRSTYANTTISSGTTNLTSASQGFGLQIESVAESSGGPLAKVAPYDGTSETVGGVDTTIREILSTTSSSVVGGRSAILIKAKASTTTPASSDYADTLTLIASSTF